MNSLTREPGNGGVPAIGPLLSETMEAERRGTLEIRGYADPIEIYAPLIPDVVSPGEGGADVNDPLGIPTGDGLGRPAGAGRNLGNRPASGLGRPASGERGRSSLPGR